MFGVWLLPRAKRFLIISIIQGILSWKKHVSGDFCYDGVHLCISTLDLVPTKNPHLWEYVDLTGRGWNWKSHIFGILAAHNLPRDLCKPDMDFFFFFFFISEDLGWRILSYLWIKWDFRAYSFLWIFYQDILIFEISDMLS